MRNDRNCVQPEGEKSRDRRERDRCQAASTRNRHRERATSAPAPSSGVFEDLSTCVQCGCDASEFVDVPPLGAPLHTGPFCDALEDVASILSLLETAFLALRRPHWLPTRSRLRVARRRLEGERGRRRHRA